jgi:hypothetical protein
MVVCAPGYPGSTAEAQPALDGLAEAVTTAAGWDSDALEAVYFETEAGGLERLQAPDVGLTLVTLPFFLEHHDTLGLRPAMLAVPQGRQTLESWVLVAGAGAVTAASDLDGWQIVSLAGHSEGFVRGPALGDWGRLPDTVDIRFSGAVLSSLRKAARGEHIAVLLDAHQAEAIDRLPFVADLEVLHRSPPLPVSVLCTVQDRVAGDRLAEVTTALLELDGRPEATEALAGVRLDRFEPVDAAALQRAQEAFLGVGE